MHIFSKILYLWIWQWQAKVSLSNGLVIQLISEQVELNELICDLPNQYNVLGTKLKEVNNNTENKAITNESNGHNRLSDEKLKQKVAAEVKDYEGGKTNGPRTDFKVWKHSVDIS